MGRPWPEPGEPLFLLDDTNLAIALAEEERDTCSSCGFPKAWCRDPKNQFGAFEPVEDFCWASYRLADHRAAVIEKMSDSQRASVQVSVRFREGREPDLEAGLDLGGHPGDESDESQERNDRQESHDIGGEGF